MLDRLKNFNAEQNGLEELMYLLAVANTLRTTYEATQVESPEWLDRSIKSVRRAIKDRTADDAARRLAELKARRAALLTPDEKRRALDEEIAKLEPVAAD